MRSVIDYISHVKNSFYFCVFKTQRKLDGIDHTGKNAEHFIPRGKITSACRVSIYSL